MATAVVNKDCDLNCPICLEKFNLPKKLPCLHTFCELCIQSYVQASETTEDTKFFRCPLCRFKIEWSTLSASEWTRSKLQTDHMILSLLERETNDSTPKQVYCEPCKIANEKNVAVYHCRDCKECFCEQCFNYLHKRKIDNNLHTVTGITPDTDLKPLEMDEPCPLHSGKVLEVFCFDHKKLCCSICFATDHRKCDTVTSLDEIANEKIETFDIDDFLNQLSEAEQCTQSAKDKAKENLGRINSDKESMLQSIADIISGTKSHLDTLHEELKLSIEKRFSDTENCQQFDIECLIAFQKTLIHDKSITEAIKDHGSIRQKFVTLEKTKDTLEKHFQRLCLAFNFSDAKKLVLEIEDKLKDVQMLSKLASLELEQLDENVMTDIKNTLCPLGFIGDHVTFQGSFPVSDDSFPQVSDPFFFAKTLSKWRIKFYKKEGKLSIYLECLSINCTNSSYEVSAEFCLVNQTDRKNDTIRRLSGTRQFCYDSRCWGFSSFIDWQMLEKEYISNNRMKIVVKVW
uniref:Tripartite motif-containing protein 3 n=1 Tax=Magallana gigas TaxID=29159 RepID=K1RZN5_MAGGI